MAYTYLTRVLNRQEKGEMHKYSKRTNPKPTREQIHIFNENIRIHSSQKFFPEEIKEFLGLIDPSEQKEIIDLTEEEVNELYLTEQEKKLFEYVCQNLKPKYLISFSIKS